MNKNEVLGFLNSRAAAASIKNPGFPQPSDPLAPSGGEGAGARPFDKLRAGVRPYALKPPMSARSAFL